MELILTNLINNTAELQTICQVYNKKILELEGDKFDLERGEKIKMFEVTPARKKWLLSYFLNLFIFFLFFFLFILTFFYFFFLLNPIFFFYLELFYYLYLKKKQQNNKRHFRRTHIKLYYRIGSI